MQNFDASSIIYAWDNYPILQFPGLWSWIGVQVTAKYIVMSSVAYDEVDKKIPECADWLRDKTIELLFPANAILQEALRIKHLLGIDGDEYHAKGVGENDLFIIATSSIINAELVSNEGRQSQALDMPKKRKIPAVCAMSEVGVACINFIEYIKRTNVVFG